MQPFVLTFVVTFAFASMSLGHRKDPPRTLGQKSVHHPGGTRWSGRVSHFSDCSKHDRTNVDHGRGVDRALGTVWTPRDGIFS